MNAWRTLKRTARRIPFVESLYRAMRRQGDYIYHEENVVMLHIGRCGSTVLANTLSDHRDVFWGGELFEGVVNRRTYEFPQDFESLIDKNRQAQPSGVYGFEVKYLPRLHLKTGEASVRLDEFVALLRRLNFTKFILLHRKNLLRRAVSVEVAIRKNEWHTEKTQEGATRINIDVNACRAGLGTGPIPLLDGFRHVEEHYDHLQQLLSKDEVLQLTYEEDIFQDPLRAYAKVCDFLDLPPGQPKVSLRKTNPFAYDELLTNFDDFRSLLENTQYQWMLEDVYT